MSTSSISTPRILITSIPKKSSISTPRILVTVVPSTDTSYYFDTSIKANADINQYYDTGIALQQDINVNADYSSIDGKNSVTIKVRYKKTTDSSYSAYTTLQDAVTSVLTLDNLYEWNVQVLVQDLFGSTTYNLTVGIGLPIVFFDRLLHSTGFNCFPVGEKTVEVNGTDVGKKKTKLLWGPGGVTTGTITLNDNINNYDFLLITYGSVGTGTLNTAMVTPWGGSWRLNSKYDFNFYAITGYVNGYFSSDTKIVIDSSPVSIRMIYGVKA